MDDQESDERQYNQQIGAKVLSQAHFESRPIVESSFNKALKRGEKLPGKNNERRNLSYLNRLNDMCPAPGYERVTPAEKRMTTEKFTVFTK